MISVDALKPEAALKYWSDKVPVTRKEFDRLHGQARAKAFTVSGLSKLDQVTAVQQALDKMLENGGTLSDFKKEFPEIIKAQGWTDKKAYRVDNIFRTNLQCAYMAGRYEQMKKTTRLRPYWQYIAVEDKRTRPSHTALDGKVYPAEHEFWDKYYPPNGFRCRCSVMSLSERQLKKRGLKVENEFPGPTMVTLPDGSEINVNPLPDKGWTRNVGKDWLSGLEPAEVSGKVKDLSGEALCSSGQFAKGDSCKPALEEIDKKHLRPFDDKDLLPSGLSNDAYLKEFLSEFGLKDLDGSKEIKIPGVNMPVVINRNLFVVNKKTGTGLKIKKMGRERYLKLLARTIKEPFEVWMVPVEVSGKKRTSIRLIRIFKSEDGHIGGYAAFDLINGREWQGVTTFPAQLGKSKESMVKYLEKQRVGVLLYREE